MVKGKIANGESKGFQKKLDYLVEFDHNHASPSPFAA